jgi:hypothetical protein
MRSSYSTLMQSKYFSPAFNSAIFDGPFRIYFAQFHESTALKIYLMIQQKLGTDISLAKEYSKIHGSNILIMMYPTQDSFILSFDEEHADNGVIVENWEEDIVIGLNGLPEEMKIDKLIVLLKAKISQWGQTLEKDSSPDLSM